MSLKRAIVISIVWQLLTVVVSFAICSVLYGCSSPAPERIERHANPSAKKYVKPHERCYEVYDENDKMKVKCEK